MVLWDYTALSFIKIRCFSFRGGGRGGTEQRHTVIKLLA